MQLRHMPGRRKKEMGKLENKITIVTGAGSGVGEATAKLFAAEGARVVIADIDDAGGARVTGEIGSAATFRRTDVGVPSEVEGMIKFAVDQFGRLDVCSTTPLPPPSVRWPKCH